MEFCESEAEFDDAKFDAEPDAAELVSAKFDEVEFGAAEFCAKEFCGSAELKMAVSSCAARFSADEVEFFAEFRRDFSSLSVRLAAAIFL